MKKFLITCALCIPLVTSGADFDKIYKGTYTWGHEVNVFQPCGSREAYWVSVSRWVQRHLLDFYKNTTIKPYQPIYIEFRGHLLDEEVGGFAADYAGLIRISGIKKGALDIPMECK